MTLYSIALFIHIVGAMVLVTAFTVEGIGVAHLRQATTSEQVSAWEGVAGLGRVFGPVSVVTILIPGLYMMLSSWGWVPWVAVGVFAWLVIAVMGAVNGIRLGARVRTAIGDPAAIDRLRGMQFVMSWTIRVALAAGIVLVMTAKPGLAGALLSIAVAAVSGLGAGLVVSRRAVVPSSDGSPANRERQLT